MNNIRELRAKRARMKALRSSRAAYVTAMTNMLVAAGFDRKKAREEALVYAVIAYSDVLAMFEHRRTETDILYKRLTRRFDPGMAMNEAYNRAMEDRKAAMATGGLTYSQDLALERQKVSLAEAYRQRG